MKPWIVFAALAAFGLSGCNKVADAPLGGRGAQQGKGRYVGLGLYPVGRMWAQVSGGEPPKDATAARPADDEQIVVVLDSSTGEVRQCGNLSGACIAMNPWARPSASGPGAPVLLGKHAQELDQEAEAALRKSKAPAKP
jgi:hypothetical protein